MIEQYGTCIKLNTNGVTGHDARRWIKAVVANLDEIRASHAGRCVLQQLHRTAKHIVIIPDRSGGDHANTGSQSWRGGYYAFRPVRDGRGNYVSGDGTGKGSDAVITITPYLEQQRDQAGTLVHEMTHASEDNAGQMYCNTLGWQYLTTAEFDAIVVQNIFLSEKGRHDRMVQDHESGRVLTSKMIPQPDAYKRLLLSFKVRMPALVSDLAQVKAAFNPYRKGAGGWVALS